MTLSTKEQAVGGRLEDSFVVAAGSVIGSDHRNVLRNNQDAFATHVAEDVLVAIVTDGCSQGRFTEVGARLGATWLARSIASLARETADPIVLARTATAGLVAYLGEVVRGICAEDALGAAVNDLLLFSFVAAVVGPERTVVFGVGDGVYAVDGVVVVLDPGPENAPPYAAYGLLGPMPQPRVHVACATRDVSSLLVATDGAIDLIAGAELTLADGTPQGGLERFAEDTRYVKNPSLLQKRLVVIGDRNGRLHDDTTVAIIRRKEEPWTSS